uniref:Uncharacterized protein n=1 Tax=Trypanosoma vivax (strain Y486) TaxID=1055687 RepID=G0TR52_TRYVY|nr:conserved hypothetical protein, fragment [Trypanosoma vivax Y486]
MGAAPSRESTTVYSYFRGTYEICLIPLTCAFFGRPPLSGDEGPLGISTRELRRQFVLMREDPAIVYANTSRKLVTSKAELTSGTFTEDDLITFAQLSKAFKATKEPSDVRSDAIYENYDGVTLSMKASMLSFAGDRTLERVLVLASVMLRNQYIESVAQSTSSMEARALGTQGFVDASGNIMEISPLTFNKGLSLDCPTAGANLTPSYIVEEALRTLKTRLSKISISLETSVDNYSPLKSLTENVAFLQCQTDVNPDDCVLYLPQVVFDQTECTTHGKTGGSGVSDYLDGGCVTFQGSEYSRVPESLMRSVVVDDACKDKQMEVGGGSEGESMQNVLRSVISSTACCVDDSNNPSASVEVMLNNGNENEVDKGDKRGGQGSASSFSRLAGDSSASVDVIRVHFKSSYVVQAALWASGLLTCPTPLVDGRWIQYRLKGESEKLRQTLHGRDSMVAQWRVTEKEMANKYMGANTQVLLRYVQMLQGEIEEVRSRPLESWKEEELVQTKEGRICALHCTAFGTMLVGIRGRRDTADAWKQEPKKGNTSKSVSKGSDSGSSHGLRARGGLFSPSTDKGNGCVQLGDAGAAVPSSLGTPIGVMSPNGLIMPIHLVPQMPHSPGTIPPANFIPGPTFTPLYQSVTESSASVFGSGKAASPLSISMSQPAPPIYCSQPVTPLMTRSLPTSLYGSVNSANSKGVTTSCGTTVHSVPSPASTTLQGQPPPPTSPSLSSVTAGSAAAAQQQYVLLPSHAHGYSMVMPVTQTIQQMPFPTAHPHSFPAPSLASRITLGTTSPQSPLPAAMWSVPQTLGGAASGYVHYTPM